MRASLFISCVFSVLCACLSFNTDRTPSIRIEGSTTMLVLTQLWAEEYMKAHPGIAVYSAGSGTTNGALAQGRADICAASRTLLPEEISSIARHFNTVGLSIRVAKDALCVYVHADNPVVDLTLAQLKKIYTGQITNWQEVGGADAPIYLLNRRPNSGTFLYFKEHVLVDTDYTEADKTLSTASQMFDELVKNDNAIGYGGITQRSGLIQCKINGIRPTEKNVIEDRYPLARYLYLYTVNTPRGVVKDFIDWVLSSKGQELIRQVGFFPLYTPALE